MELLIAVVSYFQVRCSVAVKISISYNVAPCNLLSNLQHADNTKPTGITKELYVPDVVVPRSNADKGSISVTETSLSSSRALQSSSAMSPLCSLQLIGHPAVGG
jgi:hypothetical protein